MLEPKPDDPIGGAKVDPKDETSTATTDKTKDGGSSKEQPKK